MTDPWNPWSPPPAPAVPRRSSRDVVAVACAATLVLAAGMVSLAGRAISDAAARDRAREARLEAAADARLDEVLSATPDTATVSPAPDGSKRYTSTAPDGDQHNFALTLPRGWNGRYLGAQESDAVFSDSLLTGPNGVIIVNRVDVDIPADSTLFAVPFENALEDREGLTITQHWTEATIGDGEQAFHVQGTLEDEGDEYTVRVIVFDHGNETFRVDLTADSSEWDAALPGFQRVLNSWHWG